jgi:hypothetical protein
MQAVIRGHPRHPANQQARRPRRPHRPVQLHHQQSQAQAFLEECGVLLLSLLSIRVHEVPLVSGGLRGRQENLL